MQTLYSLVYDVTFCRVGLFHSSVVRCVKAGCPWPLLASIPAAARASQCPVPSARCGHVIGIGSVAGWTTPASARGHTCASAIPAWFPHESVCAQNLFASPTVFLFR